MNRKSVAWLYEQLPELVEKGVLSLEAARNLQEYYGQLPAKHGKSIFRTLLGLLGSLLLGLGIILLVGHNWDQLSNVTRLSYAMALLLLAQVLTGWALWRKKESQVWLEGTGTFLTLTIGAVMALVGQTYHLVDDFNRFMLVWLILVVPLVYLLLAKSVAVLYLIGLLIWVSAAQNDDSIRQGVWILFILLGPYYWRLIQRSRHENTTNLLLWAYISVFYYCFSAIFHESLGELLYASLYSISYFISDLFFKETNGFIKDPLRSSALLGGIILSFVLSFNSHWVAMGYRFMSQPALGEHALLFFLLLSALGLAALLMKQGQVRCVFIGSWPLLIGLGYLLQKLDSTGIASAVLFNLYLLAISFSVIMKGLQRSQLSLVNIGMGLLTVLILLRFFDVTYSFVARGIVFILLGLAFLGVNLFLARRKGEQ